MHPYIASRRERKAGFTLIELVVVIVILGILAAIAVVGYAAVTNRATSESVEATATSFDREYRALLAFGDDQATAAASTATDFGGSATVAADSSTVEFTVNGSTGCLTLSAAPQTASTYADGACGGGAPIGGGTVTGSVTLDGSAWTPGMNQGTVTLYKYTGFGMFGGYSPVYQNGSTVGLMGEPQATTTFSSGSFSLSLPASLQSGTYTAGFTAPGNQFTWAGGGAMMAGPTSPFTYPAENGKAYAAMDFTTPTVTSQWADKSLTAMNTKATEYYFHPTVTPMGWTTQSFSIVSGPSHGSADVTMGMMGVEILQYTPTASYDGSDSIVVRMTDSQLGVIDATWTFTVYTPVAPATPVVGTGGLTYDPMMMHQLSLDLDVTAGTMWDPGYSQTECRNSADLATVVTGQVTSDLMTGEPSGIVYSADMWGLNGSGTTTECRSRLGLSVGTPMSPNVLYSDWTEWVSLVMP